MTPDARVPRRAPTCASKLQSHSEAAALESASSTIPSPSTKSFVLARRGPNAASSPSRDAGVTVVPRGPGGRPQGPRLLRTPRRAVGGRHLLQARSRRGAHPPDRTGSPRDRPARSSVRRRDRVRGAPETRAAPKCPPGDPAPWLPRRANRPQRVPPATRGCPRPTSRPRSRRRPPGQIPPGPTIAWSFQVSISRLDSCPDSWQEA